MEETGWVIFMIELPEAVVLAEQCNEIICGKKVMNVYAGQSPHKFAWYYGDLEKYHDLLTGKIISMASGFGSMVEIQAGCPPYFCLLGKFS